MQGFDSSSSASIAQTFFELAFLLLNHTRISQSDEQTWTERKPMYGEQMKARISKACFL